MGYCAIAVMILLRTWSRIENPSMLTSLSFSKSSSCGHIFVLWTNGARMLCCATLSQLCSLSLYHSIAHYYLSSVPSSYSQGMYSRRLKLLFL